MLSTTTEPTRARMLFLAALLLAGCSTAADEPVTEFTFAPRGATPRISLPNLEDSMVLTRESCTQDGASGTVRNDSNQTVTVSIDTQFLRDSGIVADTGVAYLPDIEPAQTAEWQTRFFGDGTIARCRTVIDSVRSSR